MKLREKRCSFGFQRDALLLLWVLWLLLSPVSVEGQTPTDEAIQLYQQGHYGEARQKFQELYIKDDNAADVLYYLAKLEPDADKSLEYQRRFLSLHDHHPKADEVLYDVAQYNFALGYYLTAAKDYQRLIRTYPNSSLVPDALYWLASSKLAIGAADSARFYFHRILEEHGQSLMVPWAQLGLVDAHFIAQGFYQALIQCQAFLEYYVDSPLLPIALYRLAEIHEALGERDKAKEVLQRLLQSDPTTFQSEQARRQLTEWGWTGHRREPVQETEENTFTVQVGAFSNRVNALNLQAELVKLGYQAEVVKKEDSHRVLYLVWVGSYQSREEALREAKTLERQRELPYHIIRK